MLSSSLQKWLATPKREALQQWLNFVEVFSPGLDVQRAESNALMLLASIRNDDCPMPPDGKALEERWYKSLVDDGQPDYTVYEDDYYVAEAWACWVAYSRRYIAWLSKPNIVGEQSIIQAMGSDVIDGIVDLGNGFGLSTVALKMTFPQLPVYGINLPNTLQYSVADWLARHYQFQLYPDVSDVARIGFVFASEFFEHLEEPLPYLDDVLEHEPKWLYIANTFTSPAIGHFPDYKFGDRRVTGQRMSRLFNDSLRFHNYERVPTKLWNNRPALWRLKS